MLKNPPSSCRNLLSVSIQRLRHGFMVLGFAVILLTSSGCQTLSALNPLLSPDPLELSIVQVEPENSGSYTVAGTTTLPDQTEITVSAIRGFQGETPPLTSTSPVNYAILDRQVAKVNQGGWKVRLNLWQGSTNGQLQEAWQVKLDPNQKLQAEPTVTFLATLEPQDQPVNLKRQVEALERSRQVTIARFTTDGELYLQASKTASIPPPQNRSSAVLKAVNQPLQRKPKLVKFDPEPAISDDQLNQQRQTDLPLSPDTLVR